MIETNIPRTEIIKKQIIFETLLKKIKRSINTLILNEKIGYLLRNR